MDGGGQKDQKLFFDAQSELALGIQQGSILGGCWEKNDRDSEMSQMVPRMT